MVSDFGHPRTRGGGGVKKGQIFADVLYGWPLEHFSEQQVRLPARERRAMLTSRHGTLGHISTRIRMCILRTVLMSVRGSRGTSTGTSKPVSSVSFNLIPGIEDLKDIEN